MMQMQRHQLTLLLKPSWKVKSYRVVVNVRQQHFLSVAAAILEKVGKPNIKLQMVWTKLLQRETLKERVIKAPDLRRGWSFPQDVFHWQIMDGNLTQNIQKYLAVIGESTDITD